MFLLSCACLKSFFFNSYFCFTASYEPISSRLCALIHDLIEPLYGQHHKDILGKRSVDFTSKTGISVAEDIALHRSELALCSTFDDLFASVFPMCARLGVYCKNDVVLMSKLTRIGAAYFKRAKEDPTFRNEDLNSKFENLLKEMIIPSISLIQSNPVIVEEVWAMVSQLPYECRYNLYGYWKNSSYSSLPELILAKAHAANDTRKLLRRLTKDNVKQLGKKFGKMSHSNPGIFFQEALNKVQVYDNFIPPVVDACRYLTPFSFDVLAYCILEALANPKKDRLKPDGNNIADWLQGLAAFCGSVFKKYHTIELAGIVQYVVNQLKTQKSFDLLVLKELIQRMAGIESVEDVSDQQLEALNGGETLRAEGGTFAQVKNVRKPSSKLKEAILKSELALPLAVLIAQQRSMLIFRSDDSLKHLKLIGGLFDQCQETFLQYIQFLSTHLTKEEYSDLMPDVQTLCKEFHIDPEAAFFMLRPKIASLVSLDCKPVDSVKSAPLEGGEEANAADLNEEVDFVRRTETALQPILESTRVLYPEKVWNDISLKLYVTFWSLSLYDLQVPKERYESEIAKQKNAIAALSSEQNLSISRRKKEKERCQNIIEKLEKELKEQEENHKRVVLRMQKEKDFWVQHLNTKTESITQFLQVCIFPRAIFSASDAVYCAKFVRWMHSLQTPNFSTILYYDRVLNDITGTVTSCTEHEASRYGRFLCETLQIISKWHSSKSIYEKECSQYPGFVQVFRQKSNTSVMTSTHLSYENFRHVCHKWHIKIARSFVNCLESSDYMQIRNSLYILTKIYPVFPVISRIGEVLESKVEVIKDKDTREDLKVLASRYFAMLVKRRSSYVPEDKFHQVVHKAKPAPAKENVKSKEEGKVESKEESMDVDKKDKNGTSNTVANKADIVDSEDKAKSKDKSRTEGKFSFFCLM